jgi:glycosyltransferase involved in cell wall biosynthesis
VIPIFPSGVVSSECIAEKPAKMKTDDVFIHYPAQYWAHKNHYNLLHAMTSVVKKFPNIKLVLTGSDSGNKDYIVQTIAELRLEKNVVELGFISIPELRWLYENSQGLVMPTFFGPTNMPLLEAAELGCPVACTNLPGHIEELGEYGYYFSSTNPEEMADKIVQMIQDKKNGVVKKYDSKFNIDNALKALDRAFTELKPIRFAWDK